MKNLLLLREKKAGHINQVEGVGGIVGEIAPCDVARIEVRPKWWAHVVARNALLGRVDLADKTAIARAVKAVYGIDIESIARPDIVIGSGRPATALLIWLKAYYGATAIFSGHASGPLTETIDLQLANSPRAAGGANIAVLPVPGKIDASDYRAPKPIRTAEDLRGAEVALIVGGDAHSHKFSPGEWAHLEDFVREVKSRFGVIWRVTNSRRSPQSLAPLMERLLAEKIIDEWVDFNRAGLSSAKALFGADALIVTEDSLSMVSEGLAAGRPVIALRPRKTKFSEFTEVIAYQIGQGWLASLPIGEIDADMFLRELTGLKLPAWTAKGRIKETIAALIKAKA
jgi:uncharacterized protein